MGSLTRLQSRGWPGLGSHLRFDWGRIHFQGHVCGCRWSSVPAGGQIEALSHLLSISWRPPWLLGCGALHSCHLFSEAGEPREQAKESSRETEVTGVRNLIMVMTPHHLRSGLWVRSKSQVGPTLRREDETRARISGGGATGSHISIQPPH